MAYYYPEPSHTFSEYLLVPGYTSEECIPDNVSLKTPSGEVSEGGEEECPISLNIPLVSAIMQAVSNDTLAVALAKEGACPSFYGSQSIADEAAMVRRVKSSKAGFVISASQPHPGPYLADVLALKEKNGFSTVAITEDATPNGKLLGLVTSRDYRVTRMSTDVPVRDFMTPGKSSSPPCLHHLEGGQRHHLGTINALPVVDDEITTSSSARTLSTREATWWGPASPRTTRSGARPGGGRGRVPSEGTSGRKDHRPSGRSTATPSRWAPATWWTGRASAPGRGRLCEGRHRRRLHLHHPGDQGHGRGQASALIEVAAARDEYFKETGVYVPICSDGGIVYDYHMTLALAMGADFMMLGRYFARFDESPTNKLMVNGAYVKEYWGEGSNRARNWQRYDLGGKNDLGL